MEKGIKLLIKRKEKESIIKFHKSIYSLETIKKIFGEDRILHQVKNYWGVKIGSASLKNIMEQYNYILYLDRKK